MTQWVITLEYMRLADFFSPLRIVLILLSVWPFIIN